MKDDRARMEEHLKNMCKYSVTIMDFDLDKLPNEPDSNWGKREVLAYKDEIEKIFQQLEKEIGRKVEVMTKFIPSGLENELEFIAVYFDPFDYKSLHIVARTEGRANDYAEKIGLKTLPCPGERHRQKFISRFGHRPDGHY